MGFNRGRKPRRLVCLSMSLVAMSMTPQLAIAQNANPPSAPVSIVSPLPLPVAVVNPVRVYTELVQADCTILNVCKARFTAAPAGMVLRMTRAMGWVEVFGPDVATVRPAVSVWTDDGQSQVLQFAELLPAMSLPTLPNQKSFNLDTDIVFKAGQSPIINVAVPFGTEVSRGAFSITATLLPAQ